MDAETTTPEDASALGLPLVESTTKNEIKEIKFPQKNGNDVNSKYPLAEETRKPDHGKTDEVTETRSQEIYQESSKVCMESEKQVEHQPEGYSMENKIFKQTDSEGQVMMETIPKSSEPEDETMPSLLTLAINQGEVAEKSFEIETNEEEESTTIYDDQSCRPQNELEQMNKAIDLTQFVGKDVAENEHTDENFEAPNMDNEITKHFNSEGKLNMESTIKSSYNVEERTPESHSSANSEIKDDGKTMPEKATDIKEAIEVEQQKSETESVPEDKSLSTLATTAPIMVEAVEESIQEDIHQEESPMTDTEERHKTENGFEKKTAPKVFDLHEGISNNCMEDEKKAQHRSEAQSMETMAIMHANLKGLGSTDISLRNNTEELEEDPASQTKQKLEMDGQNIMPEEEKEMLLKNEATDMQLLKSETESVREDECMEKESTAKENKDSGPENEHKQMTKVLEAIENPKPMVKIDTETEENADHLSEASIIKNVIIKHINIKGKERKSSTKSSYEMDEVEESPESHSVNSAETKEVDKITPEEAIDIKEATNMELQKSATENKALSRLHTTASVRIETVEESIQEEMQKEVESAVTDTIAGQRPENDFDEKKEVLKAFDQHEEKGNTCVENEKAEIQHEVQNQEFIVIKHLSLEGKTVEEETAVIDNNSNQPENELEQTADIVEAIDKPQTMVKVSEENEQHANHQSEASCIECITIKHIDAEGTLTTDSSTKPSSNVGKQEKIPESQSVENSGIKDGDKITPEEATDIKEATSVEIQKFNIKSVPEDKALSNLYTTTSVGVQIVEESIQEIRTEKEISEVEAQSEFPTSEIVKGETIEEILQQQTLQEEESATTTNNHKHRRPVNELEKTANIFEEIDRPEHVTKVSIANEEWEDHQSEACMESMITKHTNSEGKVGSESRIKSSYDVDELEQIPKSQLVKNSGTLKGVPEDKAPQTLSNAAFVSVEVVDGSNQDKTHMEAESAATGTKEGQKPENDFEMEETEAFGLHELTCQTSTANEMKAESQSKPQNQDTPFAKHPDFEGETTETISTSSIEEHDKVPVSHNGEKLDIKDNEKFIEVEAREMEEAAKMKLLKIETESATEDEGQSIMLTLANVKGETEEILCQQTLQEEESAVIDNDKRCRQENELPNMADVEATGQPKTVVKVCAKNEEHADCRSEASNEERVIKKHTKAEGKVTSESSTESSYSMNVLEKTEESNTIKISDIMEGVIEDKALQTLPNSTSILTETVDQSKQEETHTEVELAVIDTKEGQIPENDFEEKVKVPEVFDLHEVTCQTRVENELKVEPQSEAQNQDTTFIKYVNLEGETTEITPTKVSEEQEKVPVSSSAGKLEINNDGRFIQEEAEEMEEANEMQLLKTASEGMSEDKAQQTLPTTAYVSAEASDKSIQEEIHIKEELEVSTTKEGQIPEIDFDDKRKIPKAFGLHDVTHQTHAENVLKAEPQSEVQDQEPIIITYSNLEGETIEINPINDTEKQEKVPASHKGEILEIEDDGKFIQEEAKEMEEETKMQPQKTATESLPEDDIQSTMTTSAIVKGDPKEPLQQQALHNDETAVVDNDKSCRKENELEKMADVVEVDAEIEDQADQQSEESRIQSVIIKHINAEGIVTSESSTKSSYEADEQKIVDSHLVEDLESTCGSKITAKEATDTKQLTGVEIQKSETAKSLPDNEVLQTLPNTASLGIEVIDESSQEEIHTEVEVAVTDIIEGQTPEKDFEDKNNTPETFDLHEVACQPNAEKELKAEPKTEVQNQETTFINHQILEEETTEINPTKDTKEKEKVPASHTKGKLDIEEDDGKFKQEEAKQTHEATEMQLLKTATESLPEDEVQSTLLTFAIVKSDIKQILHQQALQDDESAAFDNKKSCRQENELEKMSNVEAIDQPEIMTMVGGENEEHADCPSEASSMQRLITNDIKIEGIVTSESRTKSSYDADKLENKVNSHSGQNYECKDGNTTTSEEAIDTKQSTDLEIQKSETESLAEDKAPQTLPNTAFVDIEAVGENIQGKEHIEAELTMAKTIEGQLLENHFQGTMNIPKAFGLHEVPCQPNAENELKVEPISEVQNHITCIKPLNLEGETTETNLTINTEEQEKFTESHNRDKSEIEDDGKFKLEEAKQIKEETEMQLLKTVVESVPQDKDLQTSPNTAFVSIETVEESIQEELPEEEEELIVTDPKEGQIPENDFEALDLLRGTSQPTAGNELKIEPQSEVQNQEVTFIKHLNLEGDTEEINPTNDTGAQEKDPGSHSREKFKIEEDGKFMREGAKGMEETTDMQLLKTTESLPENELQSTLPTSAIIQHDDKQILQQQTIQDDKSIVIDSDKSCRQESELEKISNVEAFDQTETMAKVGIIKEEQADYQSEASSTLQSVITKYNNAEGIIKSETSTKSSYDADEQAKIVESHSVENLESKDESKITAQEATDTKQLTDVKIQKSETESVHEDKSLQTLLTLVGNEAAEETSQEEIYTKMGSAVSCSKEGQTPENDFEANKDIPKVYGIQEVTCQCNEENEPKAESLSEGQNWETTSIKHLNADGENMEIAPTHDTKKQEKVAVSHTKERSWIEDDGKFIQEEAIKTATESLPEDEIPSTMPTFAIAQGDIQGDTKQILQQQTIHEDGSAANDTDKFCKQENEAERMSNVLEAIDQLETKVNINTLEEEQANHQSEASSMLSTININAERIVTLESSTKSSYDMEEQEKLVYSHSVNNLKSKDGSKTTEEEATHMKQLTDEEIQKSETESVPENKVHETLPVAAMVGNEAVDETSEEVHTNVELAVTCTKEGQISENDFDAKKDIPEAYGDCKVIRQLSAEKELKAETQFQAQNQETTFMKHLYSEGETTEISLTNDTEEHEKVPIPHTEEKLGIKDHGKFIQEAAKGMKEATESLPEDEVQSTLPTSAIVQWDTEQILQQQKLHADESAIIENNSCTQENEHEKTFNVVEATDQTETLANIGTVYKEQADHQSEASSMQCVITKYINAEGIVASENSTRSSYDADKHEKTVDSHSVENLESKDGSKIIAQEATYSKQLTDMEIKKSETESVPEDKAQQALPDAASVSNEAVHESSKEDIHIEAELAMIYNKEGQTPENDFKEKKDTPKAFSLHETMRQLSVENELKDEPQSEEQNQETTFIKHLNSDGENTEINPTNDTEEQDKFPAPHTGEKIGIEDDGKFIQEVKGMEEATELLLLNTATERMLENEIQSKLPTSAVVTGNTDEILQKQTFQEDDSATIDNKSFREESEESELEKTSNVAEAIDQLKTMDKICEENEEHADHQSEASSMQGVIAKHINAEGIVTSKSSIKSGYAVEEMENIVDSQSVKNLDVEIQISETKSVPEDEALQTLPIASVSIEEVDKGIQEIREEEELAVIDTKQRQISQNDFEAFHLHEVTCQTSTIKEQKAELLSEQQSQETTFIKHPYLDGETTKMNPTNDNKEYEKVPAQHTREKSEINDDRNLIHEEEKDMREPAEKQLLRTATESTPEDEAQSTLPTSTIVKGDKVERLFEEQTLKEIDNNNSCRPKNELEQRINVLETIDQPEALAKVSAENEEHADHQSEQSSVDNVITKHINSEGTETTENSTKSSYDVEEQEKVLEPDSIDNLEIKDGGEIMLEETIDIKEATNMELQSPEIESLPEDKTIPTLSAISCAKIEKVEESIQEEIQKEAESTATDTKDGWRPENDIVGNMKVLEAFDLHEVTSNTCAEIEKEVEAQSEAQGQEIAIIKHPNLEGKETAEKEQKVAKSGGVCEPVSADFTKKYLTEHIPKLKDLSIHSDQNTNNSISDISKISAHDYCKLESEKEEKMFIAVSGSTATSTHRNSGDIERQENRETTFEDSLTSYAIERVTTELETQYSGNKHEITNDTPAGKILQTVDTNEKLELAPGSMAIEKSEKNNSFDTTMYIADRTSIDDDNGENLRNSLQSIVTHEVAAKMDPDGQRNIDESTKMDKSELQVEKILELPYPSKRLESYFDSEALSQTNKQLYQTKEKSTNIQDPIFESDDHIHGENFQFENQPKPEPQVEGEHDFSIPLHAQPTSQASPITKEVQGEVDKAGESENIEEQTIDSKKSLSKAPIFLPREDTINQVKDHNEKNIKATGSNEQGVVTESSFENELTVKEAASRDLDEAIEEQAATGKLETQEANEQEVITDSSFKNDLPGKEAAPRDSDKAIEEQGATTGKLENQETKTTQLDSTNEEEFEKISPSSSGTVTSRDYRNVDVKVSQHKKPHGILSGMGTKVKHSISKVKKVITGKSSHPKAPSQK